MAGTGFPVYLTQCIALAVFAQLVEVHPFTPTLLQMHAHLGGLLVVAQVLKVLN